jgi:hypothetical protein
MNNKEIDYSDLSNSDEIKQNLSNLKTLGDVKEYIDTIFPNWFIATIDNYSDDYPHLKKNWSDICEKIGIEKTQILIVDQLSHEPQYSLILFFAEIFTRAGFAVRRKNEFFPCKVCNKALPSEYIWQIMKDNNFSVPEKFSPKCVNC